MVIDYSIDPRGFNPLDNLDNIRQILLLKLIRKKMNRINPFDVI
jgi:hypothetical protein